MLFENKFRNTSNRKLANVHYNVEAGKEENFKEITSQYQ